MANATLISNNGYSRTYRTSAGIAVVLVMNEDWSEIIFKYPNGKQFGEFVFKDLEDGTYKLLRMYSEPNNGGGIGRAALQMFKYITDGAQIYVSPNDGIPKDDQSHLTQDATLFVPKMIAEGWIDGYERGNNFDDGFFDM
jgi:hypothetical protein